MASSIQEISMDRISDLPDPILCIILSDLPIKNAVATSVLSTRWKTLFPFSFWPIHLDLDYSSHPTTPETTFTFIRFVYKVLNASLLDMSRVETIRICCKGPGYYTKFPDNASFPKLKSLELNGLSISDPIQGLLDTCPVLEDLSLVDFTCCARVFHIRSHVLKNLTITGGLRFWLTESIVMDTPNVQTLCFAPVVKHGNGYVVTGFKALSSAHIDICPLKEHVYESFGVPEVVAACESTSRMYLGSHTIDMLIYVLEILPTFQNLTWLGLGYVQDDGWATFGVVLNCAPNLKELICKEGFKNNIEFGEHSSDFECFESVASECDCLEFHLQKIEFSVFNWTNREMELLEFFLREGKVLETLTIRGSPLDIGTENRLLSFPNHSKIVYT